MKLEFFLGKSGDGFWEVSILFGNSHDEWTYPWFGESRRNRSNIQNHSKIIQLKKLK